MGLRDPVRPFVKGEMHPTRKLVTPRLIMAISVVDQLVERYIFTDFSDAEKAQYPNNANMVGFGRSIPHNRAITQKVKIISEACRLGPTASDVSGWERRVHAETLEEVPRIIGMRCEPSPKLVVWNRLALIWAVVSARPVYVVKDKFYASLNPGMMPSGTFMTSYGNGIMRLLFAFAAGAEDAVVLGDDCIEWLKDPEVVRLLYNDWGLETRETQTFPADGRTFTFCSKYYDSTNESDPLVVPQSWSKILASFSNLKVRTPSHLVALSMELEGLPGPLFAEIMQWAKGVSYALPLGVEQNAEGESLEG